jgi:nitroimidazol reductase NimA-like FMN-containing flavoprotein (pyridoxamine 5'-phosphate oxidase superfamily)
MKQLVRAKSMCVLSTVSESKPYCSLMAYASNDDGTEIYLATHRSTKKFRNLCANPAVSLMIDTREDAPRSQVWALTIEGACELLEDDARKRRVRSRLLSLHPHLSNFLAHTDSELLCVKIKSLLLLKGLTEAHHATLE